MKNTSHYMTTTDSHGYDRPLLIPEIYGSVLPNTIQNALIEVMSAIQELHDALAPGIKSATEISQYLELSAKFIALSPVLQADIPMEVEAPMLAALKLLHKERIALLQQLRNPASEAQQHDAIAA